MWNMLRLGLVFMAPPFMKKWLLRWLYGAKIGRRVEIGWFSAVSGKHIELGDHAAIRPLTLIHVLGDVRLGPYTEVSSFSLVYGSASLRAGRGCYIGPQSLINVDEDVEIGDESALGPRSMIFTHASFFPYTEGYWVRRAGVHLGRRVWCAAGVFIHPGVEIGDHSFVNSRSVVSTSIPEGSVVEGNPARVTYPLERTLRKPTPGYVDQALRRVLSDFVEVGLHREMGLPLQAIEQGKDELRFRWRGIPYRVVLISAAGEPAPLALAEGGEKRIYLVNRPGWVPPDDGMSFDLSTMRTKYLSDRVHTALRLFMLRYYGMRFTEEE